MAFPFYPAGAITATLLLGAILVVFRLLLVALDRGAAELRGSIGPGLVSGVRAWAEGREPAAPTTSTASPTGGGPQGSTALTAGGIEEMIGSPGIAVEPVRGHGR
jgi:hypothetical protein